MEIQKRYFKLTLKNHFAGIFYMRCTTHRDLTFLGFNSLRATTEEQYRLNW